MFISSRAYTYFDFLQGLNPCYQNDICGKYGRCVNLYGTFKCSCDVSMFFEGEYCEKRILFDSISIAISLSLFFLHLLDLIANFDFFSLNC
jgi:hypothetical protein